MGGGFFNPLPKFRWFSIYFPIGMERKSKLLIGLIFRTPSFPSVAAVVSDSSAAPIVITPCIQSNDSSTGTFVSESLPPYIIPPITTPSGLSRSESLFSKSFRSSVNRAFGCEREISIPSASLFPSVHSPE